MPHTLIPTHKVASWLIDKIDMLLDRAGLDRSTEAEEVVYIIIVTLASIGIGLIIRKIIVLVVQKLVYSHKTMLIQEFKNQHIVERCSHIVPPLVFLALIPVAIDTDHRTVAFLERAVLIYFVIVLGWSICAAFNIIWNVYNTRDNVKNLPLKGIVNLAKGLVWIIIAIIGISIIINRSPAVLLTGLGAFAAALMLVFKDSILGFVAGLQLAFNDMLHVGDWIVVPGTIANGIVTDVSLTAVKVRNWNNTTVTIPPYTLVSTSLQNWSKMKERGRRQIERSMLIDVTTVCPTTPEMLEKFKAQPYMKEYIETMQAQAAAGDSRFLHGDGIPVNGSIDTNLGAFRAFCGLLLLHHPYVSANSTSMVRLMEQTATGIPLQIFCYVNTVDWVNFEGVQSDIFEHLIAAAPAFGLSAFSLPAGRDVVNIANPKPEGLPYYGENATPMPTYNPETNYMIPPNTAGDPGITYNTETIYPPDIAKAEAAAKSQGIPTVTPPDSATVSAEK